MAVMARVPAEKMLVGDRAGHAFVLQRRDISASNCSGTGTRVKRMRWTMVVGRRSKHQKELLPSR